MEKINVCIWARVSTTIQEYTRQLNQLKLFCESQNYNVVKTFEEKQSGLKKAKDRPKLTEMLNYCGDKSNQIDMVIIDELSRLGRSVEIVTIIEKLNSLGVNVYAKKEGLNSLNPDKSENSTSMLIITISAGVAKAEVSTTKYRQLSGKKQGVKNGNYWGGGKLPYGYNHTKEGKRLVINDIEALTVNQIFTEFANGKGYHLIGKNLVLNEVKSKFNAKWSLSIVRRMLSNPI